jgi:hypothetical protein
MKFKSGDKVKLKNSVKNRVCPEGRVDNKTAIISEVYGQNRDCLQMQEDLEGCKYWNEADVELVK